LTIQEKAIQILSKYPLCDYCLGRQFSHAATGTTNQERGKAIKTVLSMEYSKPFVEENISHLQMIARSGFEIARKTLEKKEIIAEKTQECYLCENMLDKIDELLPKVQKKLEEYEYDTFLVGTKLEENWIEREKNLRREFELSEAEFLKQEFNREIGKLISVKLSKLTDFKIPQIVVEIDPIKESHTESTR